MNISRSIKKPYRSWAGHRRGAIKKARLQLNRSYRKWLKGLDELPDRSHFRKWVSCWIWRPDDGVGYWPEEARAWRK